MTPGAEAPEGRTQGSASLGVRRAQGQALQCPGHQPLSAGRQDTSHRTPARVHTWPAAPMGYLSPHPQLSPQPLPCWLPGGLCSLPALGPAGRYSAESTLLRNGTKGQAHDSLLPHPQACLEPSAACLSWFEHPTPAVRGWPSSSLQDPPRPPKPDLPRSWKPNC